MAVKVGKNTDLQKSINKQKIKAHMFALIIPDKNPAEGKIREIKKLCYRIQEKLNVSNPFWDYGTTYICETEKLTVSRSRYSKGRPSLKIVNR